jgi:hypothetical protein
VHEELDIDILRRSRKTENQELFSPLRQCSSTPVGFGQDFLAKNNVTTLAHLF